ncbi:hypothetical protein V3C99_001857 [Haemonchus contortus]
MIKQLWFLLLVLVITTEARVISRTKRDVEQEVKIIPTSIDIKRLKEEAYATSNAGERFLPGPSRIPPGLFGEKRKK